MSSHAQDVAARAVGLSRRSRTEERSNMDVASTGRRVSGPRLIALVGPFQSGKTSLFEAILERCGALDRGNRKGHLVGDASPEARAHGMTVEPDHVYLIPPKKEMIISGGQLLLGERDRGLRIGSGGRRRG